METPTRAARLELWTVAFARSSFIEAKMACDALLALAPTAPHVIASALSTMAQVFYARPFKQMAEVKLDEAVVPAEFVEFHKDIILYRDKVVAHRDAKGPATPWGSANDVVIRWKGSSMEIETTSPMLEPAAARRLSELLLRLIVAMDEALNPAIQILPPPPSDGRYKLSLRGDAGEWLILQT